MINDRILIIYNEMELSWIAVRDCPRVFQEDRTKSGNRKYRQLQTFAATRVYLLKYVNG
jgi:hypothetical protein